MTTDDVISLYGPGYLNADGTGATLKTVTALHTNTVRAVHLNSLPADPALGKAAILGVGGTTADKAFMRKAVSPGSSLYVPTHRVLSAAQTLQAKMSSACGTPTVTSRAAAGSSTDAATYATASYNQNLYPAYSMVFASVYNTHASAAPAVSALTDAHTNALTWSQLFTKVSTDGLIRLTVYYAIGPTATLGTNSSTLTWAFGGTTSTAFGVSVLDVTGVGYSLDSALQTATAEGTTETGQNVTFSSLVAGSVSGNLIISWHAATGGSTPTSGTANWTPETNWTELSEQTGVTVPATAGCVIYRSATSDTTPVATLSAAPATWVAGAVELPLAGLINVTVDGVDTY